jgi:hypothetical protein
MSRCIVSLLVAVLALAALGLGGPPPPRESASGSRTFAKRAAGEAAATLWAAAS